MLGNAIVYKRMRDAMNMGKKFSLATVVQVYGSAYRPAGAKMYVDQAGNVEGMISGGCLEADIAEVANQVMISGQPVLRRYNMDEDLVWGLGLGCPGEVEIYIEVFN